ncbi:NAD(P)-dependent alcohol dehydrogenase [Arsenicibacter rosenii]|uniref:NAD(P)-dependent alcohol dehydrogenase n=1 Tax=Arsenicibacter rosenii TaxID=1750698 RepID=A0A1S2VKL6_9BACT|nr:NAD(P)-dependent alcohol dehydrogenase [Arsenicibacter rosenii]OIN59302.1 NAD(P)-dependent alcohol dehydrogenase [Arsenicibacter rosenii]
MKAIVCPAYGTPDVLMLQEIATPEPAANQLLIQIVATAVNTADCRLRQADPFAVRFFFGLTKPAYPVLGGVFSGIVVQTGSAVSRFQVGDEVFGSTDLRFGAYAEYITLAETEAIALKPSFLSHEQAAVIPFGATTALYFIRKAAIKPGQKVLIYGASGAVGSAAVQLARYFGAEVTGVCSAANAGLVRQLGAQTVIDYARTDLASLTETYDVVMDTINKLSVKTAVKLLNQQGTLILSAAQLSEVLQGVCRTMGNGKKLLMGMITSTPADLDFLNELIQTGALTPVLDRTFPLSDMAAAHRYVEAGHKRGNVAISMA